MFHQYRNLKIRRRTGMMTEIEAEIKIGTGTITGKAYNVKYRHWYKKNWDDYR